MTSKRTGMAATVPPTGQRLLDHITSMLPVSKKKRINLVLSERHIERLERLQRLTDAASVAEVVRESLFVYEKLVEKLIDGSTLFEKPPESAMYPLELGIDVKRRSIHSVHSLAQQAEPTSMTAPTTTKEKQRA